MIKKNLIKLMLAIIIIFSILMQIGCTKNYGIKENGKSKNKISNVDLRSLNIDKLEKIRSDEIDKNLKRGQYNKQYAKNLKNNIINSNYGLVSFINKKYCNLSEKEKLIREINLIKFETSVKNILDPSGEYFLISNQIFEINQFLLNHKRNGNVFSYDNVKYLIINIKDLSNYVDFDVNDIVLDLTPITNTIISNEQKNDLIKMFKKQSENDKLSLKIRNAIKKNL